MNFHSVSFGVFLVVVFALFWSMYRNRNARTILLAAASYLFYSAFNPLFLLLIGFSTGLDYWLGGVIHRSTDERVRKRALLVSLTANLGLLGFFKYYDWGVETLQWVAVRMGFDFPLETLGIIVPVGISFYTFQTLSYTIDVYRRRMEPARNLLDFALFVAFFPQLVAGPIVRAIDFLPQLDRKPRLSRGRLHDGLYRIALGVGKKTLIADVVGSYIVDPIYGTPDAYPAEMHFMVVFAFLVQIYYDFSGYSDIAIGSARILGFDLPENFDLPFRTRTVRDFWRRWHITLGAWVRDYVFFPLGGSRGSEARVAFNLMLTMFIIGLWHGANWLWVIFGIAQGLASVVERAVELRRGGRPVGSTWRSIAVVWSMNMLFVGTTYICIRANDVAQAHAILTDFGDTGTWSDFPWFAWLAFAIGIVLHYLPRAFYRWAHGVYLAMPTVLAGLLAGIVVGVAALLLLGETPFIYFQF